MSTDGPLYASYPFEPSWLRPNPTNATEPRLREARGVRNEGRIPRAMIPGVLRRVEYRPEADRSARQTTVDH